MERRISENRGIMRGDDWRALPSERAPPFADRPVQLQPSSDAWLVAKKSTLLRHECGFGATGHAEFADDGGHMRLDGTL